MSEPNELFVKVPLDLLQRVDLDPTDKLVWAYLLFRQGQNGSSWRSHKVMAAELGVSTRTCKRTIARLVTAGMIEVRQAVGRSHTNTYTVLHDPPAANGDKVSSFTDVNSDNVAPFNDEKRCQLVQQKVTSCPIKGDKVAYKKNKGKEQRKKNIRERGRFTPPTPSQVAEYASEIGSEIDSQRFVDYYESKGWMVGSTPMRDWKAAVKTWISRERKQQHAAATPAIFDPEAEVIRLNEAGVLDATCAKAGDGECNTIRFHHHRDSQGRIYYLCDQHEELAKQAEKAGGTR